MNTRPSIPILCLALVFGFGCRGSGPERSSGGAAVDSGGAVVSWVRAHAIPISSLGGNRDFSDLRPLGAVVGDARIVALGESGHGVHEFLAFRNRLFEYLVREKGFTAIAVETGFLEGTEVDDYIGGAGAESESLIWNVFNGNGSGRALEENRQLVNWIRDYNKGAPGHRIHFYGIDLTGWDGHIGTYNRTRRAVDAALAYVARCDSSSGRKLEQELRPYLDRFNLDGYARLSASERYAVTAALSELVSTLERRRVDFVAVTPTHDYERAHRHAVAASAINAMFRTIPDSTAKRRDLREFAIARDAAMAANVSWVLRQEGPTGRILLFAHNAHVQKCASEKWPLQLFPGKPPVPMGAFLKSSLLDPIVVLGFAFNRSGDDLKLPLSDSGSVDGELARVGPRLFAIDLRRAPGEGAIADWLEGVQRKRWLNDPDQGGYLELRPRAAFDVLLFVDSVSAVRPVAW